MSNASSGTSEPPLENASSLVLVSEDEHWVEYTIYGSPFVIPARFRLINFVGRGAFGVVCSAQECGAGPDEESFSAIKRVAVRHDNPLEVRRLVREVYLLDHFEHDNIVRLHEFLPLREPQDFRYYYFSTELSDTDLHQIIRSPQSLSGQHIRFLLYQILRGLKGVHSAGVLHRDLKPGNILLNANCDLKLADFGLAREMDMDMTAYVATRWYRAPELLMQALDYGGAVDIWSTGCIFAELLTRKPLFAGANYIDQLTKILEFTGKPPAERLLGSARAKQWVFNKIPDRPPKKIEDEFPNVEPEARDLLAKMLTYHPADRITAAEALRHPYLAALHDEDDEPECPKFTLDLPEDTPLPILKKMLFEKIVKYHPEMAGKWTPESDKYLQEALGA